ncbi:hypothetical protein E3N88_09925 [Mikania micrantha]|uniref:Phospholipase-like protein n=1 Tax=Mikania micrantha TaxID=192012 RepID=A0A5N6PAZ3_9ASTR|nr:hypothetical protein E3N88_09925 [Mikania micrantha]
MLYLVNDLGAWNTFPWGSYLWRNTYPYIHDALQKNCRQNRKKMLNYRLKGFTWAFKKGYIPSYICSTLHEINLPYYRSSCYFWGETSSVDNNEKDMPKRNTIPQFTTHDYGHDNNDHLYSINNKMNYIRHENITTHEVLQQLYDLAKEVPLAQRRGKRAMKSSAVLLSPFGVISTTPNLKKNQKDELKDIMDLYKSGMSCKTALTDSVKLTSEFWRSLLLLDGSAGWLETNEDMPSRKNTIFSTPKPAPVNVPERHANTLDENEHVVPNVLNDPVVAPQPANLHVNAPHPPEDDPLPDMDPPEWSDGDNDVFWNWAFDNLFPENILQDENKNEEENQLEEEDVPDFLWDYPDDVDEATIYRWMNHDPWEDERDTDSDYSFDSIFND